MDRIRYFYFGRCGTFSWYYSHDPAERTEAEIRIVSSQDKQWFIKNLKLEVSWLN